MNMPPLQSTAQNLARAVMEKSRIFDCTERHSQADEGNASLLYIYYMDFLSLFKIFNTLINVPINSFYRVTT